VVLLLSFVLWGLVSSNAEDVGTMYDDDLVEYKGMTKKDNQHQFADLASQDLSHITVNLINSQIKAELEASHVYMSMYAFFSRADVAYRGFAKFFKAAAAEEREHGQMFVDYLNSRGGYVELKSIARPEKQEWLMESQPSPLEAFKDAHRLERSINDQLLKLHESKDDPHLQDFLEGNFLNEQVESIKKLSDWITVLRRLKDNSFGIHQFDEELFNESRK